MEEEIVQVCIVCDSVQSAQSQCEISLVAKRDNSKQKSCKNSLSEQSEYFAAMFRTDLKEKQTNLVELEEDICATDLAVFLHVIRYPADDLPSGDDLCGLMFLADRFICPKIQSRILEKLKTPEMFNLSAAQKLHLLEMADRFRGTSVDILEACVRLCGNLEPDEMSSVQGKVTDATMAVVSMLAAKVQFDRPIMHNIPFHWCGANWDKYHRVTANSFWVCDSCGRDGPPVRNLRFGHGDITFEQVCRTDINRNWFR